MLFNVELVLTTTCNAACPYCYVKGSEHLSIDTFKQSLSKVRAYTQKSGCDGYTVTFFGGEPLLRFDTLKAVVSVLKADPMCQGLTLTTNGTLLTLEIRDYLKAEGIGISWSFDGITSTESRKLKSGDIINTITKNKDLILSLTHGCKAMVYPQNCGDLVQNYEFLKDFGLTDIDFSIVRDDIWCSGSIKVFRRSIYDLKRLYARDILNNLPISIGFFRLAILDTIIGLSCGKREFSCFAGVNGCALMPDGKIYACERFAVDGKFCYDTMSDPFKYRYLYNPKNYHKCRTCMYNAVCNCGCLHEQLKNGNEPLRCVCDLYKIIFRCTYDLVHELAENQCFRSLVKSWIKFDLSNFTKPKSPILNNVYEDLRRVLA